MRTAKVEVTEATWDALLDESNRLEGRDAVDSLDWIFAEKSRELYMFLIPKLSPVLATAMRQVDEAYGFELWRVANKEKDRIGENAQFHLEVEIQEMGRGETEGFEGDTGVHDDVGGKSSRLPREVRQEAG